MRMKSPPLEILQGVMEVEIRAGEQLGVGADNGNDYCVENENVIQGVQKIISDLKSTPIQTLQEVKVIEQGAGVLQGDGVIQCDPGFVTKDVQQKVKSSPLQTPQGVTSMEQGAGVLEGGPVENDLQCDPEVFETKCADEKKVQGVQEEKAKHKCMGTELVEEI